MGAGLKDDIPALLETIQSSMFAKARQEMTDHIKVVKNFDDFLLHLENKCLLQVPFCGAEDCEDEIKEMSKKDESLGQEPPVWEPRVSVFPSPSLHRFRIVTNVLSLDVRRNPNIIQCLEEVIKNIIILNNLISHLRYFIYE